MDLSLCCKKWWSFMCFPRLSMNAWFGFKDFFGLAGIRYSRSNLSRRLMDAQILFADLWWWLLWIVESRWKYTDLLWVVIVSGAGSILICCEWLLWADESTLRWVVVIASDSAVSTRLTHGIGCRHVVHGRPDTSVTFVGQGHVNDGAPERRQGGG
jgi:hypothetical protein